MARLYRLVPIGQYNNNSNTVEEETYEDKIKAVLRLINSSQHKRCERLLNALLLSGDFNWKASGEIIYKGNVIHSSHVADLCSTATKSFPVKKLDSPGMEIFLQALKDKNIPRDILSTQFRAQLTKQSPGWKTFSL